MKSVLLHFSRKQLQIIVPVPIFKSERVMSSSTRDDDVQNKTDVLPGRLHEWHVSDDHPNLLVLLVYINNLLSHELHGLFLSDVELLFSTSLSLLQDDTYLEQILTSAIRII